MHDLLVKERELCTVLPCPVLLENFTFAFKKNLMQLPGVLCDIIFDYVYTPPFDFLKEV